MTVGAGRPKLTTAASAKWARRTNQPCRILRRPKGVRPPRVGLPKNVNPRRVIAVLTGENFQVAGRVQLAPGRACCARIVLDTGSGASLIRKSLLPKEVKLQRWRSKADHMIDINGGVLPIVGAVTLPTRLGTHEVDVTYGVVENISVPLLLGTPYVVTQVPLICGPEYWVKLMNGETIPILGKGKSVAPVTVSQSKPVCSVREGFTATLRLARKVTLPPNSVAHVDVVTDYTGNGLVHPHPRLARKHQVHVALGTMDSKAGVPWRIQVMNLSSSPKYFKSGAKFGYIDQHEGPVVAVTLNAGASSDPKSGKEKHQAKSAASPRPHVNMEGVPPRLRVQVERLLDQYHKLWDGQLGLMRATQHRIELKPGAPPIRQQPYRGGPRSRALVKEQVARMEALDVIEASNAEWASPVVIVPKVDGTPRFCIDYRKLNESTVKDSYPLPRMDDCLDSLGEANVFSTLDCNAGYWQIPIAPEDRHKTTFTCHCGTYQCKRLPFGLCNAPATFQRAMDMILAGVRWQICLVYLDDIIVFSRSPEEHIGHLGQVFKLLADAGVSLKASKCHLFTQEVEYLGHVVRPGRLSVNEKNLRAIRKAQYPRTQTQMRSFLGMCNVYRRFTKGFAKVAKPLNELVSSTLPKNLPPPSRVEQESFETLRDLLLKPPILAIPRLGGHYILDVDASYDQLGCVLLQQQPDKEYLPVGYFSKGLNSAEKNYGVTELEGLAVVWAVTSLRHYLEGEKFLIRCDHRALQFIFKTDCTNTRLNRWRVRLAPFNFDIEYRPGRQHALADGLSRVPTEGLDTNPVDEDIPIVGVVTRSGQALNPEAPGNKKYLPLSLDEVVKAQAEDPFCKSQRDTLDTVAETRFFLGDDGLLMRRGVFQGTEQLVVPASLKDSILEREHNAPTGGHLGSSKLYQTLRTRYYWPSMVVDIYSWVAACTSCAQNRLMERRPTTAMLLFPAKEPFAALAMDILGPLPVTEEGNQYLLVICDRFTKLTRAIPLAEITAMSVVSAFLDHWVAAYGIPDSTLSDNGPQFASVLFQGVLDMLGVKANYATPYHPQTNGQVERFNKTIVRQLRHYVSEHVKTWDQYISILTTAYNSQVHSSTGEVPLAFVTPRRVRSIAVRRPLPTREDGGSTPTPTESKAEFAARLENLIPKVRAEMDKAQKRYKRTFDKKVRNAKHVPEQGDWVLVHSHTPTGGKLVFQTKGPYQVLRTDGRRFTIESDDGVRTVNGQDVVKVAPPPAGDPAWARALEAWRLPSLPAAKQGPQEYVFDKFIDHGWDEDTDRLMLRVRWFGYKAKDDTWEYVEDLPAEKVRAYCARNEIDPNSPPST